MADSPLIIPKHKRRRKPRSRFPKKGARVKVLSSESFGRYAIVDKIVNKNKFRIAFVEVFKKRLKKGSGLSPRVAFSAVLNFSQQGVEGEDWEWRPFWGMKNGNKIYVKKMYISEDPREEISLPTKESRDWIWVTDDPNMYRVKKCK